MNHRRPLVAGLAIVAIIVSACGSGASPSPSVGEVPSTAASEAASAAPGSPGASTTGLGPDSFDGTFKAMAQLKGLVSAGKGLVGVILPDTTSSARYTSYDLPYLNRRSDAAGYTATTQDRERGGYDDHRSSRSPRPTSRPAPRSCSSTRSTGRPASDPGRSAPPASR